MCATYVVSGVRLESNVSLPSLLRASAADRHRPALRLRLRWGSPERVERWDFHRTVDGDAKPWLSVLRQPESYLLRVHGIADFRVDGHGRELDCTCKPGAPLGLVEHVLLDQILPQVLQLRGMPTFTFHASAVERAGGKAIAFAGPAGSGKSTLAGSLAPDVGLVCDDCLAVCLDGPGVVVLPSYPSVRLRADSLRALLSDDQNAALPAAGDKWRASMPTRVESLVLEGIYLLRPADGEPTIVTLSRRDALVALAQHLDRLDPDDRERIAAEIDPLAELVARVWVAELRFPHRYETLAAVRAVIEADAARRADTG